MNTGYLVCTITFLCRLFTLSSSEDVGEGCHNYGGVPGRCALVKNCPLALDTLAKGKPLSPIFKRCGWKGTDEIVCCPGAAVREHVQPEATTMPVWGSEEGDQQNRFTKRKCEQVCDDIATKVKVKSPVDFNIIDGEEVKPGEFPHMAALGYESEENDGINWNCGAVLISSRYLLTAGHCVVNQLNSKPSKARLGVVDLINSSNNSKQKPQDFGIEQIKVHHRYSSNKQNDIALIKLDRDIEMSDMVYPACLYTENNDPQGLLVTGWGRKDRTDATERSLSKLLKGTLNPVDTKQCNKIYQQRSQGTKTITKTQICAFSNLTDTCDGDSGGPLQILNKAGTYSVVGVTSYGFGCGGTVPGVYTRVSKYLTWIENHVWPN